MKFTLPRIEDRLQQHQPHRWVSGADGRQAGVAIILRACREDPELLFIRRAERPGDPWSGHMAFPGGHRETGDKDLTATAARETEEEVGLNLATSGRFLAELDQTRAQRGPLDLVIGPSAFALEDHSATVTLNDEVAEVIWVPLAQLMSNEWHRVRNIEIRGDRFDYNGFDVPGGYFIWGLTYRMLKQFFRILDPGWQPLDEDDYKELKR